MFGVPVLKPVCTPFPQQTQTQATGNQSLVTRGRESDGACQWPRGRGRGRGTTTTKNEAPSCSADGEPFSCISENCLCRSPLLLFDSRKPGKKCFQKKKMLIKGDYCRIIEETDLLDCGANPRTRRRSHLYKWGRRLKTGNSKANADADTRTEGHFTQCPLRGCHSRLHCRSILTYSEQRASANCNEQHNGRRNSRDAPLSAEKRHFHFSRRCITSSHELSFRNATRKRRPRRTNPRPLRKMMNRRR